MTMVIRRVQLGSFVHMKGEGISDSDNGEKYGIYNARENDVTCVGPYIEKEKKEKYGNEAGP